MFWKDSDCRTTKLEQLWSLGPKSRFFFLFHVEFRYVLIYIPHGPSSNAHLLELLKYILIYFFAFFDSLYIILNIAASAEKSTVTYFVTASGK